MTDTNRREDRLTRGGAAQIRTRGGWKDVAMDAATGLQADIDGATVRCLARRAEKHGRVPVGETRNTRLGPT
jgi:hypothetical protein